jgi:hypothetical protein
MHGEENINYMNSDALASLECKESIQFYILYYRNPTFYG